jgi:hypothetical protein
VNRSDRDFRQLLIFLACVLLAFTAIGIGAAWLIMRGH